MKWKRNIRLIMGKSKEELSCTISNSPWNGLGLSFVVFTDFELCWLTHTVDGETETAVCTEEQLSLQQLQQYVWWSSAAADWPAQPGGRGGSLQTCPGWRAEATIFNTAQHPPITTAVLTSPVCPLSGIASLSGHSLSLLSSAFPLLTLCLVARSDVLNFVFSFFKLDRWLGYSCGITALTGRIIYLCKSKSLGRNVWLVALWYFSTGSIFSWGGQHEFLSSWPAHFRIAAFVPLFVSFL